MLPAEQRTPDDLWSLWTHGWVSAPHEHMGFVGPLCGMALAGAALATTGADQNMPDMVRYWADLLRDVGFPIFVAGYVLYRIEPQLARLSDVLREIHGMLTERTSASDSSK